MALKLTPLPEIPIVQPGDDIGKIILTSLKRARITLLDGDIIVIAQKIVSKSENRFVNLNDTTPSKKALKISQRCEKDPRLVELILSESRSILRVRSGTIIVEHRLGFICANAGIDHSNVRSTQDDDNWVLLLPLDPEQSSDIIRKQLESSQKVRLGVMIIDSHGRPWRLGVVGSCIGLSGLPGLIDKRGDQDLFGRTLRVTTIGAADELAAAASLVMGQADERNPIVHVRGFPYSLRDGSYKELLRPQKLDMFR